MKWIRIKPGNYFKSKRELRTWYVIVLGDKPNGYKTRPWVWVSAARLPDIFKAIEAEFGSKYH